VVAIAELVVHAHLDNVELGAAFAAVAHTREMVVGAQIDVGVFQTKLEVIAQGALHTQTRGPADMRFFAIESDESGLDVTPGNTAETVDQHIAK